MHTEQESVRSKLSVRKLTPDREENMPKNDLPTLKAFEVARKIKSFDHFAYVWGERGRFFLPPRRCLSWGYISQVLSGQKRLLKVSDVGRPVEIPKAKGILIRKLFEECRGVENFGDYFPDGAERRSIPRSYFYTVDLEGHEESPPPSLRDCHEEALCLSEVEDQSPQELRHPGLLRNTEAPRGHRRKRNPLPLPFPHQVASVERPSLARALFSGSALSSRLPSKNLEDQKPRSETSRPNYNSP